MAETPPFVHLHTESEYGLPDGLCRLPLLADRAARAGYPAVGLADRGTLHAAHDFYDAALARGVKPVLGCELSVCARPTSSGPALRTTFFAETLAGWHRLVALVSQAHLDGPTGAEPVATFDRITDGHEGIIALWNPGPDEQAETEWRLAKQLAERFGPDRFFLERRLRARPASAPRTAALPWAKAGIPSVITAAVQFLDPAEAQTHAYVRAIRGAPAGTVPEGVPFWTPNEVWARCPGEESAMARAAEIAARCTVEFPRNPPLLFPRFEVPEEFRCEEGPAGHREFSFLETKATEGLRIRYGLRDPAKPANAEERIVLERFQRELDIIRRTGFVHYFLVVWDIVRFAREQNFSVGPGRGSGAGSLVAYALGITGIDPIRYGLIFERFLNPSRVSPPDFDIDFNPECRSAVIDYIRERYGPERVAHIVTFQRFGLRQAVRDAARLFGLSTDEGDRLARRIPETASRAARPKAANPIRDGAPAAENAVALARAMEGLPRNTGTHAAGLVIGPRPLRFFVPLMRDHSGHRLTQFEGRPLAQTGLLKLDLLGLVTLGVIDETRRHLNRLGDFVPDPEQLPQDDPDTFARIGRGDTLGVFQLESAGMRDLLRRVRIRRLEELAAIVALYRPGPMHLLEEFVRRDEKSKQVVEHPLLKPILEETRGLLLYQEQVQQTAQALAGFSLAQGDLLRKAITEKDTAAMSLHRTAFLEGCRQLHRIPKEQADRIFDTMERFAAYGFNKSHSVAYAALSYRCAFLKTHYPAAFMAAWLASQTHDPEKLRAGYAEVRALGCTLLPPDINRSEARFAPEDATRIRFGLSAIRNVSRDVAGAAVIERETRGPFAGLSDFCLRTRDSGLHRVAVESLIKAGAFDQTGVSRGHLLAGAEAALQHAQRTRRDEERGQLSLFPEASAPIRDDTLPRESKTEWNEQRRAAAEKEVLGMTFRY